MSRFIYIITLKAHLISFSIVPYIKTHIGFHKILQSMKKMQEKTKQFEETKLS